MMQHTPSVDTFTLRYLPDVEFARFKAEDSDVVASSVNNKISKSTCYQMLNDGANIHYLFYMAKFLLIKLIVLGINFVHILYLHVAHIAK